MPNEPVIEEILELARALHPKAFLLRIDDWRSGAGGGASWLNEFVSSSPERSIPVTQPTDNQGKPTGPPMLRDQLDRKLQMAKREFLSDLDDIRRLLVHATVLQQKWLFDIVEADPTLVALVSDSPICRRCKGTKEMWEHEKHKSPWRIKGGVGPCCYSQWSAEGRPDLPPVDARTMKEAYGT